MKKQPFVGLGLSITGLIILGFSETQFSLKEVCEVKKPIHNLLHYGIFVMDSKLADNVYSWLCDNKVENAQQAVKTLGDELVSMLRK